MTPLKDKLLYHLLIIIFEIINLFGALMLSKNFYFILHKPKKPHL
jgi:hypothetical protein